MQTIYLSHPHIWKSSPENPKEKPKLEFADPLFKRRLSQITRMTIQVLHDLIQDVPEAAGYKQVFVSLRGEIEREFTINKGIIEDCEILPAAFSLSVFNAPVAAASLCLGLKSGYSVIFPSRGNFADALKGAAAPVLAGSEQNVILVYADEYVPDAYGALQPVPNIGLSFACILSATQTPGAVSINIEQDSDTLKSPLDFVKSLCG